MSSVITPLFGDPAPGCYVVDAATSSAVLLGSARPSIAVRPLRVRACVTGRVTIAAGGEVLDAAFLLTPEPGLRLRRGPAWRRGPTCVTTVRTYRISSCQYRTQIELAWAKLAASAVLSLWTRAPQPGDRPHTLRLRALTAGGPFEALRRDGAAVAAGMDAADPQPRPVATAGVNLAEAVSCDGCDVVPLYRRPPASSVSSR